MPSFSLNNLFRSSHSDQSIDQSKHISQTQKYFASIDVSDSAKLKKKHLLP